MKNWLIGTVVVAVVAATMPSISEAKRLGGGSSSGMQRNTPARTAPDATPAKPAAPQQAAPAPQTPATAGAAHSLSDPQICPALQSSGDAQVTRQSRNDGE